jgi:Flp pilus assembly protein CpaB
LLPKDKNSLESQLTPGKRAWAVKITQDSSAGGFVLPGSHVDVIHVTREGNRGAEAKVILENVLVRAIDLLPVRPEDRPGMVGGTATLELTPEEVIELAQVHGNGYLMLSLRAYGDSEPSKSIGRKTDVAIAEPPPPPPPPTDKEEKVEKAVEPAAPETTTAVVTVFNGSSWVQTEYTLNKNGDVVSSRPLQRNESSRMDTKVEPKPAEAKDKDKDKNEDTK